MSPSSGAEPTALDLPVEQMRALGYAAVDAVVEHMATIRDQPAYGVPDVAALEAALGGPPPQSGTDPQELVETFMETVIRVGIRSDHPGMLAYIPNHPTFPGAVADLLIAGTNIFAGSWQGGPGAAVVELAVLDWIRDLLGLASTATGIIQSGGSMANLVGLAVARERHLADAPDRVAYVSDQAHSSIARALRLLGVERVREVASDERFRLLPEALAAAVADDRAAGRTPWCVAAAAGATNTGSVDDLRGLAAVAAEEGLWLHVDGAYGGFLALTERGRTQMQGLELADSLVLDAHKSLYVPIAAGILLVRHGEQLERAFSVRPEYLRDAYALGGVSFSDRGPELTRPLRALKVWMTIKSFGFPRLVAALDTSLDLAEQAAHEIAADPGLELVTGPWLGMVTFRSTRGVPAVELVQAVERSGRGMISTTELRGETVARICVLGHRTRIEDIRAVLAAARTV
ncbi:MAG TPA: aminotransferase class I/II-fold pyridoxal phosphate-dependent enzyme [Gaiellales bacterium]|nr:aminotransferase class I/II-fold pyridoxal phosphate-dependent enzyme [Gaiellales bacterium]